MIGRKWKLSSSTASRSQGLGMMTRRTKLVAAALCAVGMKGAEAAVGVEEIAVPLQRVAFGSCNHQSLAQDLWSTVLASEPQLWIWMGDAIYGDYKEYWELKTYLPPFRAFREATPTMLRDKYSKQLNDSEYSALRQRVPVVGVWDDHDYGINDGDRTYSYRKQSQQLFLDFLGEPSASSRRDQEGVYTSYTIGSGDQTVKILLLDVRYHKDPYGTQDGDFLGSTQWQWLKDELASSSAAFNIIVSGVQILPQDRFYGGEDWSRFPLQRERLINLILTSSVRGVILLSGDVHYAEINQVQCEEFNSVLTEVTSSGMTHSWDTSNIFDSIIFRAGNLLLPWEYRPHRNAFYGGKNFGEIEFDWDSKPLATATVRVRGEDGMVKLKHTFSSHFAEHTGEDPARTCKPIQPASLPVVLTRRLALVGFVGLFIGGIVAVALALIALLVLIFRRSYYFMMDLQRRLFDHGYQKLD